MMKSKKILILLLFSIILISAISTVSAADSDMSDIQSADDGEVALEESDDNVISDNEKSFKDLSDLINNAAENEIGLEYDYKFNNETDNDFLLGVTINRQITINGNGHIIDGCNNSAKGFETKGQQITFKNITFLNLGKYSSGYDYNGGAIHTIYSEGTTKAINCTFIGCKGYIGGAVYYVGVENCTFIGCKAYNNGGAVYSFITSYNCLFENNSASSGGAIYYGSAVNCTFIGNQASNGGAATGADVINSTFIRNSGSYGGAFYGYSNACINCTFIGNKAYSGGAAYASKYSSGLRRGYVVDCHFENNTASYRGGAANSVHIIFCTFTGNTASSGGNDYYDCLFKNVDIKPTTVTVNYPTPVSLPLDLCYHDTSGVPGKFYPNSDYYFKGILLNFTVYNGSQEIGTYQGLSGNPYELNLDVGTYTVRYSFADPAQYSNLLGSAYTTIYVKGFKTSISAMGLDLDYNQTGNITATLYNDTTRTPLANKTLVITFNGQTYANTTDENGQITIIIPKLPADTYPISINFYGDSEFDSSSSHIELKVLRIDTKLEVEDVYAFYQEGKVHVKLTDKYGRPLAGKNIEFELSDIKVSNVTNGSGEVEFDLGDLNNGTYSALVLFRGDEGYMYVLKYINVKIGPLESTISAPDVTFIIGEDGSLIATLTETDGTPIKDADLKIDVDSISETLRTNESGQVKLNLTNRLALGTYDATITFAGNVRYYASNANAKVSVVEVPTVIAAADVTCIYNDGSFLYVTLKDKYGNPVKDAPITLSAFGQTFTNNTDANGEAKFLITLPARTHVATISYAGNASLQPSSTTAKITVQRINVGDPSEIVVKSLTTEYNSGKYLVATLKDSKGNPIANAKINVVLNGKTSVLTTNSKGQIKVATKGLPVKTYDVKFTYDGDSNYLSTESSVKLIIKKVTTKVYAKNKAYKLATKVKKYKITLKSTSGKAIKKAKVTLKVKSKTYTAKTNSKGKATFKITKLTKKGKFTALIKYKGSKVNKSSYKKVKITVK